MGNTDIRLIAGDQAVLSWVAGVSVSLSKCVYIYLEGFLFARLHEPLPASRSTGIPGHVAWTSTGWRSS